MKIILEHKAFPAFLLLCTCLVFLQTIYLNKTRDRDLIIHGVNVQSFHDVQNWKLQDLDQSTKRRLKEVRNITFSKTLTRRLPTAIIIGVKKCGTRALIEYLRLNPNIRAAGPEPHFFDRYYHLGLDWYRQKMPKSYCGHLTIEKTPRYFVTKEVPARIYNMSKSIKLILVVRNPVTRAISDFTQAVSKGEYNSNVTFQSKAIRRNGTVNMKWPAVNIGLYVNHLRRWLEYFPMDNIHIVDGEKLITNPWQELNAVQDFLQVKRESSIYMNTSRGFPCIKKENETPGFRCFRNSKGRPHFYADTKTRKLLHNFYKPYNIKFFKMINKHFMW